MTSEIMMNRLYLDPALIRAAHDEDDPHHAAAAWLLDQIRHGEIEVAVSELTWLELADYPVTTMIAATFRNAGVPTLAAPPALVGHEGHRQVMHAAGITAILSTDASYDSFDELTRIDPEALHTTAHP
jgi:predicted nucleic acid-binding protein